MPVAEILLLWKSTLMDDDEDWVEVEEVEQMMKLVMIAFPLAFVRLLVVVVVVVAAAVVVGTVVVVGMVAVVPLMLLT